MSAGVWDEPLLIIAGTSKRFTETFRLEDEAGESFVDEVTFAEFRIGLVADPETSVVWSIQNGRMSIVDDTLILDVADTDDLEPGDWRGLLSIGIADDIGPVRPQAMGRVVVKREP